MPRLQFSGQWLRSFWVSAGATANPALDRISFIDAFLWLQTASPGEELSKLVVNPHRPNRYEQRVVKRRPKSNSLMTKPRRDAA